MTLKPDSPITLHTAARALAEDGYENWTARRLAKAMRRDNNALLGGTYTGDPIKDAGMRNMWTTLAYVREFVEREAYRAAQSLQRLERAQRTKPKPKPQNLKSLEEVRKAAKELKKQSDYQRTGTTG